MLTEVKIGPRVDSLHLAEAKGHLKLDVCCRIGIVCQLLMVVEAVLLVPETEILVPLHPRSLPLLKPVNLRPGLHEELHLHLLKLAHTEDKLPRHDLIAERLTDLCDAEGDLHTTRLLDIEEIDKDPLRCLGPQVDRHRIVRGGAHLRGEHKVELPDVGPVARAAHRVSDLAVEDQLMKPL